MTARRNRRTASGRTPAKGAAGATAGEAAAYRRAALAAPLLAVTAVLALAGCGGGAGAADAVASAGGKGKSATTPVSDQVKRYRTCMEDAGVPMYLTGEGVAVVDKEKAGTGKIDAALAKCRSVQPTATPGPALSAEDLARLRGLAVCIRQHGVPDYPDPDPVTGEPDDPGLAAALKSDPAFRSALTACQTGRPSGEPAAG